MTRLSNRQYPMLRAFTDESSDFHMNLEEAARFDQRPFRSMLIREYISYKPGKGFHLTKSGRAAYHEFLETDILRRNPNLPLTAYFDADAYGIKRKGAVHVMKRRTAA